MSLLDFSVTCQPASPRVRALNHVARHIKRPSVDCASPVIVISTMNKTSPQSIRTDSRAGGKFNTDDIPNFTPLSWYAFALYACQIYHVLRRIHIRSMKDIREVIPSHLLVRDTWRGLSVLGRDILIACTIFMCTLHIGRYLDTLESSTPGNLALLYSFRALLWCT